MENVYITLPHNHRKYRTIVASLTVKQIVFSCLVVALPSRENMRNTRFIKRNIILHNSFKLCNVIRSNENCARISLYVMINRATRNTAIRIFHMYIHM